MASARIVPTDACIYKFQLVEFIRRGPKTARAIDIVPTRWIDTLNGKTPVSKFMEPPYTPEKNQLLQSLVKADAEAPTSWPVYSIKIKGQAKTYAEALKKLDRLKVQLFVLTTETDVEPATKGAEIEKKIIRAKKYTISKETRNAMLVPPMNSDSEDDPSDLQKQYSTENETSDSPNDEKKKPRKPRPKFPTKSPSHILPKPKKSAVSNNLKPTIKKPCPKMPLVQVRKQVENNERDKRPEKKGDSAIIVSQLEQIAIDIKEVLANQNAILFHLNASGDRAIVKKFSEKHSLSLPFGSESEFKKFNERLRIDDEFRKEFISSLDSLLDRELVLTKSITNICKKYLARKVALKYTVSRRVPGKSLLKETMFYDCILGVGIQAHKDSLTGKKVTEQVVDSAFGRVINNAKDWDGQRLKRALSKSKKKATVKNSRRDGGAGPKSDKGPVKR